MLSCLFNSNAKEKKTEFENLKTSDTFTIPCSKHFIPVILRVFKQTLLFNEQEKR